MLTSNPFIKLTCSITGMILMVLRIIRYGTVLVISLELLY